MSACERRYFLTSPVGVGTHYRNITEFVEDQKRMHAVAEATDISPRHVRKDSCDQWTIFGKAAQLQTAGDETYLLFITAYSARKWGAIKRKAKSLGWEVAQDGDDEGTLLLRLPGKAQAKFLRSLLGLRTRRGRSEQTPLNAGVSLH